MARKVKSFNSNEYEKELRTLEIKLSAYNSVLYHCSQIKEGLSSIEEVEKYLNTKTKFVNPRVSADAMGVLSLYETIEQLTASFSGLNMTAIIEDTSKNKPYKIFKIDNAFREYLRDKHTTYYTAEQSRQIERLEGVLEGLNSLETPYKTAIAYNRLNNAWEWVKQHTDNTIRENSRVLR